MHKSSSDCRMLSTKCVHISEVLAISLTFLRSFNIYKITNRSTFRTYKTISGYVIKSATCANNNLQEFAPVTLHLDLIFMKANKS